MKTGLVIYAGQLNRLADFYTAAFDLAVVEHSDESIVLRHGTFELVILETTASSTLEHSSGPARPRESTPIKPAYFLDGDFETIREQVITGGGSLSAPKSWKFNGNLVCDGWDPEGNIFQLRIHEARETDR
ncbi:MAG: hypothetical protein AAF558_10250 [Verrucomicrobiota bacterium]